MIFLFLIFGTWCTKQNSKREKAWRDNIENENREYKRLNDSLENANKLYHLEIATFKEEVQKLEQNLIKSEIDKRNLQLNLNNFKVAIGFSEGVNELRTNLKNEKDIN